MCEYLPKAIGGYFELELPVGRGRLYPDAIRFQSARAAFYALLAVGKPNRVWMPTYICNAMLAPLDVTKTEIAYYDINFDLGVPDAVQIEEGDWLLYVNYFGVCDTQENILLKRLDSSKLIFDHSQAFFSSPKDCLATIYSPRKFFGVPDGGLLLTPLSVVEPEIVDVASVARSMHLLRRLESTPEVGYQDFKISEEALCDMWPRKMSSLTDRLLTSIDSNFCKMQRNSNFNFLHQQLARINNLNLNVAGVEGPMCYPLLIDDATIRRRLLENRIFVPTYWQDACNRMKLGTIGRKLLENCLPLPCDHRYNQGDMARIIRLVKGAE